MEKIVGLLLMLNLNKYMLQFLFKSFEKNGASLTTLLNFISNNILNVMDIFKKKSKALNGYFILSETISL